MNRSDSIKELAAALAKFQAVIKNPKTTSKNPLYNSKYAPLDEILELVRPVLGEYGLSIMQDVGGELENIKIQTTLFHSSGEWIESDIFTLKGEQTLKGGGKALTIQGAGSMITYAKRYQVAALLGLHGAEDDDGNHAPKARPTETPEEQLDKESKQIAKKPIDADKVQSIKNMLEKTNTKEKAVLEHVKANSLENMNIEQYIKVMDVLNKKYENQQKEQAAQAQTNEEPNI